MGGRNWKLGSAQASKAGAGAWPELGKSIRRKVCVTKCLSKTGFAFTFGVPSKNANPDSPTPEMNMHTTLEVDTVHHPIYHLVPFFNPISYGEGPSEAPP